MEDDVYVLQEIGVGNDDLEKYRKMRIKLGSRFAYMVGAGVVLIPMLVVSLFFEYQNNNLLFLITISSWFLPVSFLALYFSMTSFKITKKYVKMLESVWLIWPGSQLLNNNIVIYLMIAGFIESFIVIFILGYVIREILMIVLSLIFIALIGALPLIKKVSKMQGYIIHRLFRGDVDQIAEKLAIALNGKKKLLIKSQNNRKYEIEFDNPYKFRVFAFRRPDKVDFVEISVIGVKLENVSEAKQLISRIEKTIQ